MTITRITKNNIDCFRPFLTEEPGIQDPTVIRLGVTDDNGKASGAVCARLANGRADIISLYVLPSSRRQGVAWFLMEAVEEIASDTGFEILTAEFPESDDTCGFFSASGYDLFKGNGLYCFSIGELLRSPLYRRYITGKTPRFISNVSDLDARGLKAVDSYTGIRAYDPKWSTAEILDGRCFSCMLSDSHKDFVNIIWLNSSSKRNLILLQHFCALANKAVEKYSDNDVMFRMTFSNEALVRKIEPLLGGPSHMHIYGHLINAIKLL